MPKCKNDPKRYYKGTEPSPKGKGYCAHAEKIGKKMKGRDGQTWVVRKAGKSLRWARSGPQRKITKPQTLKTARGSRSRKRSRSRSRRPALRVKIPKTKIKVEITDQAREFKGRYKLPVGQIVNLRWMTKRPFSDLRATVVSGTGRVGGVFEILEFRNRRYYARRAGYRGGPPGKKFVVPIGATYTRLNLRQRKAFIAPPEKRIRVPPPKSMCPPRGEKAKNLQVTASKSYFKKSDLKSTQVYFTHDNGGRPFKVMACSKAIEIYVDAELPIWNEDNVYNKLVKRYTKFGGYWAGYDSSSWTNFTGNSILIQLDSQNYVYIGTKIYSFKTNEKIVDYYSPVGNNDVPYPVAYGEKNVYFMRDHEYVPIEHIKTPLTAEKSDDMYGEFYRFLRHEKSRRRKTKPSFIKKMKGFKGILERDYRR